MESRFDLAYNAAHALCLAALRWHGYRSGNRYLVFQLLPHTLGLGPEVWRVLAKCHEIRNPGEYEGDLNVDERIVTDLVKACSAVAAEGERIVSDCRSMRASRLVQPGYAKRTQRRWVRVRAPATEQIEPAAGNCRFRF